MHLSLTSPATEVRTVRALSARALAAFVGLLLVSGTVAMMVAPLLSPAFAA